MSTDIRPASAAAPTVTRVLRTVGAVIGGAPQPLWFMLASVGYGMVFAGLGGVAAARLAPTRPLVHAAAWLSPWRWCWRVTRIRLGCRRNVVTMDRADLMAPSAYLGGLLAPAGRRGRELRSGAWALEDEWSG